MDDQRSWDLLARNWAGHLARPETDELRAWLAAQPDRARVLRDVTRIMDVSRDLGAADQTADAWERVQQQIHRNAPNVRPLRSGGFARALWKRNVVSQSRPAFLMALGGIAAAVVAAAGVIEYRERAAGPAELRTVTARFGERMELELPDGSGVVLGAMSTLRWAPIDYARDRTVWLDGDGYFTVESDPARPFVVRAHGAAVQAVGTAFGMRARSGDSVVRVVVAKGRVLLRPAASAAGTGTLLDGGDLGELDVDGRARVARGVDIGSHLGWLHDRIAYDATPAHEIASDLERWYGVVVQLDDPVADTMRLTMTTDLRQPAALSIQRLAEVLDLRLIRDSASARLVPRTRATTTAP